MAQSTCEDYEGQNQKVQVTSRSARNLTFNVGQEEMMKEWIEKTNGTPVNPALD